MKKKKQEKEFDINDLPLLTDDAYEDADGLWHYADGELVPDGCYRNDTGEMIMYEGNFEAKMALRQD